MTHLIIRWIARLAAWMVLSFFPLTAAATTDPLDPALNHAVTRTDTPAFVADGENTGGTEYSDTDDMVELSGSLYMEAKAYYKRFRDPATGEEELRVYFSVHDTQPHPADLIEFYFDRLHNHGSAGGSELDEDVMLRIARAECASPCAFNLFTRIGGIFGGAGSVVNISNAVVLMDNVGEYSGADVGLQSGWTGEFVLTPADLGWSYFPQDLGHLVAARSGNQNQISNANALPGSPGTPSATYPLNGGSIVSANAPANWGNLKLRYPIDYAVIMDFSGSMLATDGGGESRWVRAKRAADLFVAALGLFENDMFDDRISISQYSWSCSDDTESGDTTGAVPELGGKLTPADIPPPSDSGSYTSDNATDPAGNNCTPIKAGIEFALEEQLDIGGSSPNDKRDRIAILLSDGLHNQPSSDVPFDPDTDFSADEKQFTQIRTVALGNDGVADTLLLAEISTAFNGGVAYTYEAKFNQTSVFSDLLTAYLETLQAPLTINQVPKVGATYSPGAPDKLVFIGVWNTPANAAELTLTLNGSPVDTSGYDTYVNQDVGYSAVVVDDPEAGGEWELASSGAVLDNEFVLADLRILARFLTEQKPYSAGDPMLLQVSLRDNGQPILGADVTVEAAVPGEGLGNYLSTVGDNCEPGEPRIPKFNQDDSAKTHVAAGINFAAGMSAAQPGASQGGDPLTGRNALAAAHFERCHKEGLDRNNLPGVKLVDDGTNGDLVAGDGVYSLSFKNTNLEGSYNLRFFALGETTDGVKFGRMRLASQYVGIEPDSAATQTTVQAGPNIGGMASQFVFFLPKDALGNYMGPGFNHKFKVSVTGGLLHGNVIDLNNGYYVQVVRYSPQASEPVVTITTTDGCFEKVAGKDGEEPGHQCPPTDCEPLPPYHNWYLWLFALIILLLLILLIRCWFGKRR